MQIVIVGAGKVGTALCANLSSEGHDITLIEREPGKLQDLLDRFDILGLVGNGSFYDVQKEAKVDSCDIFISVTPEDEVNIISCVIAKKMGAAQTIARVRTPEYASHMGFVRENLGITRMINPEMEAAQEIYRMIQFPSALSVEPFSNAHVNFVELPIQHNSLLNGMSMIEFRQRFSGLLGGILLREDATIIPGGATVLHEGDRFFVTGKRDDLSCLYKSLGTLERIRSVLIIGGGRITYYLLDLLRNSRIQIKVIEHKEIVALDLADQFPHVDVIQGDGTDQNLLIEENIDAFDCVITMTGIDEENVILSMFANSKKVPRTITKINRTTMLPILNNVGLQSIVTPAEIMATTIVRIVRSVQNAAASNIEALLRLPNGSAEVLQFYVRSSSESIGKPLVSLDIKSDTLIGLIIRKEQLIFPTGQDQIYPGDHVIVITKHHDYRGIDDILRR